MRLHQVIYEHIQQYSVNEIGKTSLYVLILILLFIVLIIIGAMIIICDMNEYRRVLKEFKVL